MQTPPPYMPAPKKNNTGLIIGLVIGGIFLCCLLPVGLLVGGGFWAFNKGKGMVACAMAYENVRDATLDYAKAHGGKLPPAEKWMDEVRPYYQKRIDSSPDKDSSKVLGVMPVNSVWSCDNGEGGQTGMAFNKDLGGKKVADIKDPEHTYLLFETPSPAANLNMPYKEQPAAQSPKIFNETRGWFKAPVEGELDTGKMRTRGRRNGVVQIEPSRSSKGSDKSDKGGEASSKGSGE